MPENFCHRMLVLVSVLVYGVCVYVCVSVSLSLSHSLLCSLLRVCMYMFFFFGINISVFYKCMKSHQAKRKRDIKIVNLCVNFFSLRF